MPTITPPPTPGTGGAGNPSIAALEQEFVNSVAAATRLDPRVVYAWVQAEGAYAPGGTGGYNFLNLRPARGDVGVASVSSGNFDQFGTLQAAISSTVARINNPFALGIRQSAGKSPVTQLQAIASSGWDAGHYATSTGTYAGKVGGKLLNIFSSSYGQAALGGSPSNTPIVPTTSGSQVGSASSLLDPLGVGAFLGKITSADFLLRTVEVIGGGVLILTGLYLLAKQIGLAPDAATVAKVAAVVPK